MNRDPSEILNRLLIEGQTVGLSFPWHRSKNAYKWLIAESLLRRTTRTAALRAYRELLRVYPSWVALSRASEEDVAGAVAWMGLGRQRARQLVALARAITERFHRRVPKTRAELLQLPGVGNYTADAIMLYVRNEKAFPIDANVQRVLRRALGMPTPVGTRHSEPYRDRPMEALRELAVQTYTASELATIHRAILHMAWASCRPHPQCGYCPLRSVCFFLSNPHSRDSSSR